MHNIRRQFREFLLRLAENNLRDDDWSTFAVRHRPDAEIERIRQSLVKSSFEFPDWQIGWIPRAFQKTARELAELLRELDEDSTTYRTEQSEIGDDGTIYINASWFDAESHSTGYCEIAPESDEYEFWKWLISHDELSRGRKSEADIQSLKSQYANESKKQAGQSGR